MTTTTLVADRSTHLEGPTVKRGHGQDPHLPIGLPSGSPAPLKRAALGFPTVAWPASGTITSATLRVHRSSGVHVPLATSMGVTVRRATSSWIANAADGHGVGGSTSPTVYPGPTTTAAGAASASAGAGWTAFDVTAQVRAMAPAGMGGGGGAWLGFLLMSSAETAVITTEFWSARYADAPYRPTLEIVYDVAAFYPPDPPVLTAPVGSNADATTMRLTHAHPNALGANAYDLELRDGSSLIWFLTAATATIAGNLISTAYAGPSLVVGHPYTWRARTRDTLGQWGAWSAYATFTPSGVVGLPPSTYDRWAAVVLAALAEPAVITRLGTITPIGPDEILPIVCAEYGDRWQVVHDHVVPPIDRTVRVLGMSVSLTPDGVTVDAITEEAEA